MCGIGKSERAFDECLTPGESHQIAGYGDRVPSRALQFNFDLNQFTKSAIPTGGGDLIVAQEAEIMNPAPFMRALGSRDYGTGNVYEMRTYTYASGDIPKVLDGWSKAIEAREKFSPLAACWTSELGGLNKFVHTWVYKDLNERARVREASRTAGGPWPPQTGVRPIRQDNKLLIPAAFSPVR